MRYWFGGLIFGGAYTWRGLFSEFYGILDHFLVVGDTQADWLLRLLQDLGFTKSQHKLVSPTQRLIFLGVKLNTISCTVTLPEDKLRDLQAILSWTCRVL